MRKPTKSEIEKAIQQSEVWRDRIQPKITSLETPGAYSALMRQVNKVQSDIRAGLLGATTQAQINNIESLVRYCQDGLYSHVEGNSWHYKSN